ncbi:hypothetical protein KUTeg_021852 [Tegillarca granosa]|uniref:Uncharacterized protein n=1 Tax=Tegillarca granosa TaxID=220873 RepID=A0ABQ9E4J4_TEGGR|nr:hypothetical protein KUTeg_021852 [Tegillarca granosa]
MNEMKKRLKELAQNVKGGKYPIEPQHEKDVLGKTFKDIQTFMNEQMNKSFKEHDQSKRKMDQAAAEIQTLKENLKKAENKFSQQERKNKEKENKSLAETSANMEEIKRLENEVQRLRNALKDLQNRAAQGRVTKIVYRPESESDRSSLNSEEKVLYDELQRELMELRRHMRSKEEDNANRLAEAETEAAMLEQAMKDQERQFEKEFSRQQEEFELMKEKQEARMQVIAQDLDQATQAADYLQGVLDERERQLDHELQEADMTNHMITAQEEELVRLYEILDAQRDEIERLNDMLDGLSHQGLDAGPGFDDELWRLRQEVNRLKETLAMQTAYVQTMPQIQTSTGTQAQFGTQYDPPPAPGFRDIPYQGQAAGPLPRPQLSQYQGVPMSMGGVPVTRSSMGTSYAGPPASSMYPHPAGTSGIPHGGQRDVTTPPGVRPAGATERQSRSADGRAPGHSTSVKRPSDRVHSEENDRISVKSQRSQGSHRSRRSAEGRRSRSGKGKSRDSATAFEPVHKPQAYKPVMSSAPTQSYSGAGQPAYGTTPGFQPISGPSRGIQTVPYIGASRGIQTGGFRPGLEGSSRPGIPGAAGTQTPGYASTQTPGYASVQTPGYAGTQTGAPPGVGTAGAPGYVPVVAAPAQRLGYSSDRVFLPAYSTAPSVPQGRIYYPASSGPGQAPAPPPPPPPPPPPHSVQIGPPSPGPHVTFLPLSPIASGTPVKRSRVLNDGSMTAPPSPIVAGSIGMDSGSHPRGILKNAGTAEDSYLFCNVPEHHDLEDYIAELQEKLKRLKIKISKDRDLQREAEEDNENRLVRRLRGELEERRDELEGLDLAIERQKKNLKQLRKEEKYLEKERRDVKEDLEILRIQNSKFPRRRKSVDYDSDESFETRIENSRQKYLKDEIECLERTLAKRRGQLRDADRMLKECNNDIRDAREQARDTVNKFDKASTGLENTLKESNELERRANEAGVELIKASDTLSAIRSEVKDLDRKKHKQERLLRDITQVISKRDSEFKDLDARVRSANQNLQRIQADLAAATRREKETMDTIRDAETVLGKRRAEIARMREQIESQRQELEKVDQMMGKRRTELQLLEDTTERKKVELNNVLRDAEGEVNMKQRELRDYRDQLRQFEGQKVDLMNTIKTKRGELQKLKDETATEEEVLNKLLSTLNKHKSELKHTYEMQKLEQTSLESVKAQHSQKVAELDKTQKELLVERSELEQLNSENSRKAAEIERLRQAA